MSHEMLVDMKCPLCDGAMTEGYIAGRWIGLRWCLEEQAKTIYSGTPLKKRRDLWNAPTLDAVRCEKYKVGVFSYDN